MEKSSEPLTPMEYFFNVFEKIRLLIAELLYIILLVLMILFTDKAYYFVKLKIAHEEKYFTRTYIEPEEYMMKEVDSNLLMSDEASKVYHD